MAAYDEAHGDVCPFEYKGVKPRTIEATARIIYGLIGEEPANELGKHEYSEWEFYQGDLVSRAAGDDYNIWNLIDERVSAFAKAAKAEAAARSAEPSHK